MNLCEKSGLKNASRHTVGVLFVLCVVVLWVASSTLTQVIFHNKSFDHPFFLTYFTVSWFMIYFVLYIPLLFPHPKHRSFHTTTTTSQGALSSKQTAKSPLVAASSNESIGAADILITSTSDSSEAVFSLSANLLSDTEKQQNAESSSSSEALHCSEDTDTMVRSSLLSKEKEKEDDTEEEKWQRKVCKILEIPGSIYERWSERVHKSMVGKLSVYDTLLLAREFGVIWFLMSYTFNMSLDRTSVSSNTILSSMSGPFSLAFSMMLLRTRLSWLNGCGVFITVMGNVLVAYLDKKQKGGDGHNTFIGDVLSIVSAFVYGFYVTRLKFRCEDESKLSMYLFFACVGLMNTLFLWPLFPLLAVIDFENFAVPSIYVVALLSLNALLSVASDYFWAQSILLTSPVVATVGISLMIPLALAVDMLFKGATHPVLYWCAASIVTVGFVLVNLDLKASDKRVKMSYVGSDSGSFDEDLDDSSALLSKRIPLEEVERRIEAEVQRRLSLIEPSIQA